MYRRQALHPALFAGTLALAVVASVVAVETARAATPTTILTDNGPLSATVHQGASVAIHATGSTDYAWLPLTDDNPSVLIPVGSHGTGGSITANLRAGRPGIAGLASSRSTACLPPAPAPAPKSAVCPAQAIIWKVTVTPALPPATCSSTPIPPPTGAGLTVAVAAGATLATTGSIALLLPWAVRRSRRRPRHR
jgi:hypothetical protein